MLRRLLSELKTPATLIAVCLAAISIIFSVLISTYFYYRSVMKGEISYFVNQIIIFDQKNIDSNDRSDGIKLRITDDLGKNISGNVYIAEITIWNSGNDEINNDSVRVPFKINIDGDVVYKKIYFSSATRNNVDQFSLNDEGVLSWAHFDPNEGFKVRVLYAAKDKANIALSGRAVRINEAKEVRDFIDLQTPKDYKPSLWGMLLVLSLILLLFAYVININLMLSFYKKADIFLYFIMPKIFVDFIYLIIRFGISSFLVVLIVECSIFIYYSYFGYSAIPDLLFR